MLRAIAIYQLNDEGFVRDKAEIKPGTYFNPNEALTNFEKETLPKFVDDQKLLAETSMYSDKSKDGEFYYLQWLPERNRLLLIISQKELFEKEPRYLLINVNHVDQRGDKVKTTLKDILVNPMGYTGMDLLTHAVRKDVEELKVVVLNARNTLLERGEKVETLEAQSARLFTASKEFRDRSEELKNSFTCCGGVQNTVNEAVEKIRVINNPTNNTL